MHNEKYDFWVSWLCYTQVHQTTNISKWGHLEMDGSYRKAVFEIKKRWEPLEMLWDNVYERKSKLEGDMKVKS